MKKQSKRMWAAMAIVPLVAPALFALWQAVLGAGVIGPGVGHNWKPYLGLMLMETGWVLFIGYVATAVIGLPLVLWLRSRSWLRVASVCIAGLLAGLIAGAVTGMVVAAMAPPSLHLGTQFVLHTGLGGLVLGLATGLCFCVAAGITVRSSGPPAAAA